MPNSFNELTLCQLFNELTLWIVPMQGRNKGGAGGMLPPPKFQKLKFLPNGTPFCFALGVKKIQKLTNF